MKLHHDLLLLQSKKCSGTARFYGSIENEAFENEDRSTKHPKTRKRSTQVENEAPKVENEVLQDPPQTRQIVIDKFLVVDDKKLSITKHFVCESTGYRLQMVKK